MIKTDISGVLPFVPEHELLKSIREDASAAHCRLTEGNSFDYLGWMYLPGRFDMDELRRIHEASAKICRDSDVLVVIGIGGSYLGAKAVLELLRSPEYNLMPKDTPDIYFAGNNLSGEHFKRLVRLIGDRDFSVNVISKSGSTLESAVAFRLFRSMLEKRYGKEKAAERIYATTDSTCGALRKMAEEEGYTCFSIPGDIGGRYSVFTAVGLLPLSCAGIDIDMLLKGAENAMNELDDCSEKNPAYLYAAARRKLYELGKTTEIFAVWSPEQRSLGEWWKQLFGESEGKKNIGIFPAAVEYSGDLHSMGQYIQEGRRDLMETMLCAREPEEVLMPETEKDDDGLNYLAGRSLAYVNRAAQKAVADAHISGGVPCIKIETGEITEETVGELLYFFMFACAISAIMSGVDPFDQPGVEAYKKNMKELLRKGKF